MKNKIKIYQVDAFTSEPFRGNPAAVCLLDEFLPDEIMQSISAEMNLSETAFAVPLHSDIPEVHQFHLRWFTPVTEVDLCGHATLAMSKIIFDHWGISSSEIRFQSRSGELRVYRQGKKIELDFPSDPPVTFSSGSGLREALGVESFEGLYQSPRLKMLLVVLPNEGAVRALKPDFMALQKWEEEHQNHGFIVTAPGEESFDFVSRFFCPGVGIPEDPVTGSAHTVLSPYWGEVLGKREMTAHQASSRGGDLLVVNQGERVLIRGEAVIVMEGEFYW